MQVSLVPDGVFLPAIWLIIWCYIAALVLCMWALSRQLLLDWIRTCNQVRHYLFFWVRCRWFHFQRRVALFIKGYRRPPFMLWLSDRKMWGAQAFNFYMVSSKKGTPNLCMLQPAPRNEQELTGQQDDTSQLDQVKERDKELSFYLWPDRIRWHFFILSGAIGIYLWLYSWLAEGRFLTGVVLGGGVFILGGWLLPTVVFFFFRVPVLNYMWRNWPRIMDGWLRGIPQKGTLSAADGKWVRDGIFGAFPPLRERIDLAWWAYRGSVQESMLRSAVIDFFTSGDDPSEAYLWRNKAFFRWILYWCSPITINFALIALLLGITAMGATDCKEAYPWLSFLYLDPIAYVLPCCFWLFYSYFFLWRESNEFQEWAWLRWEDWLYLPPALRSEYSRVSTIRYGLPKSRVQIAMDVVITVAVSLFLYAIALINDTVTAVCAQS